MQSQLRLIHSVKLPALAVFDVDGLLLNTEFIWLKAHRIIAEEYNVPEFGDEFFLKGVGLTGEDSRRVFRTLAGKREDEDQLFEQLHKTGYRLLENEMKVRPGVFELLDFLKENNVHLAVATTTNHDMTMARLGKTKLLPYFHTIVCGDQVAHRKPDPEIYQNTVCICKCQSEKSIVFEDSPVGVEAAHRAGIPCIMCPSVVPPTDKQREETIAIVNNLADAICMFDTNDLLQ